MFEVMNLGLIDYQTALDYQNILVALKHSGMDTNYFLLMEHNHVYTKGKGANLNNILDNNISVITTNRGGDLTYHGPGQLIGYLIIDLKAANSDIHMHIRNLENLIVTVLNKIDIKAYTIKGLTGVWAKNKKIASIGVGVKKGITMHGFALNINPDMSYFSRIMPCGLNPERMSSLEELENKSFSINEIENFFKEKIHEYL